LGDKKFEEEMEKFMLEHENWFTKETKEIDFNLNRVKELCS
jgi:hypothetical protein